MPTYTYKCNNCNRTFEKRQRMSAAPLTDCIFCEEGRVRRVINSVGVVFKGNGFYVTDNRGKKVTSPNGTGTNAEAKEGESKSESKAEPTTKTSEKSA